MNLAAVAIARIDPINAYKRSSQIDPCVIQSNNPLQIRYISTGKIKLILK